MSVNDNYNEKRNEIIAKYKKMKRNNILAVLGIGVALLLIIVLLKNVLGIAVTLVGGAMVIMITVIFLCMRVATVKQIEQDSLLRFENNNTDF